MSRFAVNGKIPLSVWCPSRDDSGNRTTTLNDLVGSNHGTLTGFALTGSTSNWVADTDAGGIRALDFAVDNDLVNCGTGLASVIHGGTKFSISAWIKVRNSGPSGFGRLFEFGGTNFQAATLNSTRANFITSGGVVTSTITSPSAGSWLHIVTSSDIGGYIRSWVNGVLYTGGTVGSGTFSCSGQSFILGNRIDAARSMDGMLDDVRVFNVGLDSSDVAYLYNSGFGRGILTPDRFNVNSKKPVSVWCPSYDYLGDKTNKLNDLVSTNHGTLINMDPATDWVDDTDAGGIKAIDLDGVNDRIDIPSSNSLNITGALTISSWVKLSVANANNVGVVAKWIGNTAEQRSYALTINNQSGAVRQPGFLISPDGTSVNAKTVQSPSSLNFNQWYHIVGVYIPSTSITIYVNGVQVAQNTTSIPSSLFISNSNVSIGDQFQLNTNYCFGGRIDDCRIFNTFLNTAEISYLYKSGRGRARLLDSSRFDVGGKKPVAVWCPSRDSSGVGTSTLRDLVGQANGTLTNMDPATDWANDTLAGGSKSLDFDGTDDHVVASTPILSFENTTFTVSTWFKSSALSGIILALDYGSVNPGWSIQLNNGKLQFGIKGVSGSIAGGKETSASFNDNNWHHICVIYTTSTSNGALNDVLVYVDGVLVTLGARLGTAVYATPSNNFWIGRRESGTPYYSGSVDDIRIFNTALSSTDIAYLYNSGFGRGIVLPTQFDVNNKTPISVWCPSRDESGKGTNTLNDLVGSSQGTLTNMDSATDWVNDTDAGGIRALDFDGSNDYISANSTVPAYRNEMSFSFWIKAPAQIDKRIISFASSISSNPIYLLGTGFIDQTKFRLLFRSDNNSQTGAFESVASICTGSWVHVVLTDQSGSVKLYINGVLDSSPVFTRNDIYTFDRFTLGALVRSSNSNFLLGSLDDVRIWNSVLSASDVSYLYNSGNGRGRLIDPSRFDVNGKRPTSVWCPSRDSVSIGTSNILDLVGPNNGTLTNMDPANDWVNDTDSGGVRALDFDGVNDFVNTSYIPISSSFSVSFWAKYGSLVSFTNPIAQGNAGLPNNGMWSVGLNGSNQWRIIMNTGSLQQAVDSSTASAGVWTHIVAVYTGSALLLYRQGNLVASIAASSMSTHSGSQITLGARLGPTDLFNGRIDDVRFFSNYILNSADVSYLYNSGLGRGRTKINSWSPLININGGSLDYNGGANQ